MAIGSERTLQRAEAIATRDIMGQSSAAFWTWSREFSDRIVGDEHSDPLQDELLARGHHDDDRLYFLLSANAQPRELIITADGNRDPFRSADTLVLQCRISTGGHPQP